MISNPLLTLSAYNKSVVPFCTNDHYSLSKFLTYYSLPPLAIYGKLGGVHWRQYPQAFWVADIDRFHWEVSHHGCRRKSLSYPRGYVGSFIRISLAFFAEDWSWNHERWRRLTQWDRHHQRSVWLANKRRNFAAWIPWIARENTKSVDKQTSRKWGKWVWKLFFECFALYFETVI